MLETIREYGLERLRAGDDLEPVRRRHAEEYLGLAVRAEPHLTADDQGAWLDRCEQEHANLRAALRWAIEAADADRAQAAAGALWRFWQQRGHLTEGRRWLEEVLAMPSGRAPTPARAKALAGAGGLSGSTRDIPAARAYYDEALAIERRLGDPARIGEALYNRAFVAGADGDFETAARLFEESLEFYRQAGDEAGIARAEWMVVIPDLVAGNWDPPDRQGRGGRGHVAPDGRPPQPRGRPGLDGRRLRPRRPPGRGRSAVLESLELFRAADSPIGILSVIFSLAYLARWEERYDDALRLVGTAESLREQIGGRVPVEFLAGFLGDPEAEARAHLSQEAARRAFQQGRAMTTPRAGRDAGECAAG